MRNGQIAYQIEGGKRGLKFVNPDGSGLRYATGYVCRASVAHCNDFDGPGGFAWSPDGKQLAYLAGQDTADGSPDELTLYLVGANGDHLRRLTVCGQCEGVSWSPDGSQIAVARYAGPRGDGTANLWVVNARNGAMRQVTHCQSEPVCRTAGYLAYFDPEWSPTGQAILFTRIGKNGEGRFVYMVRPDGSDLTEPKNLRNRAGAQWSPNGHEIVTGGRHIGITNADGKDLTRLSPVGVFPAWSPDGRKLVYEGPTQRRRVRMDGSWVPGDGIWTINANGSDDGSSTPSLPPWGGQAGDIGRSGHPTANRSRFPRTRAPT